MSRCKTVVLLPALRLSDEQLYEMMNVADDHHLLAGIREVVRREADEADAEFMRLGQGAVDDRTLQRVAMYKAGLWQILGNIEGWCRAARQRAAAKQG